MSKLEPNHYEYAVLDFVQLSAERREEMLSRAGQEGWKLHTVVNGYAYLERGRAAI